MDKQLLTLLAQQDIIIFDFDGTLINSEPYHKEAHNIVLREYLGDSNFALTDNDFCRYIGKKDPEIFEMYKTDFNIDYDSKVAIAKKLDASKSLLLKDNVGIFDYFFEVAKIKKDKKFFIVSNQMQEFLLDIVKSKNIMQYFDKIFCLGSMKVSKHDFFANINNYINTTNLSVAMFEDNNDSLLWGKQNNFVTIGIESHFNRGKLTNADYIIKY